MNYIDIPSHYRISKEIPVSKFHSSLLDNYILRLTWEGNIKPPVSGVSPTLTESIRYEEIQFFHCELSIRDYIFEIERNISKEIKYPSVIEFQVGDATTIGTCEFDSNKTSRGENVLRSVVFSHWLHTDILSPEAQNMINTINIAIRKQTDMKDIYSTISGAVLNWKMGGTSKSHVGRIIYDLLGKGKISVDKILLYCQPYEYHQIIPGQPKYSIQNRTNTYTLIHDYEEIWYCLQKCPETKRVIETRQYRGVEDMFFSIDSKGW